MRRVFAMSGGVLGVLLALVLILLGTPVLDPDLSARAHPLASYADAAAQIQKLQADEAGLDLIPEGHSIALLTGSRTATAVLIFHGFTSVPAQFRLIAQGYRDQGYNVWVPRLPFHGERNRLTDDPSRLTSELLRDFADANVDIVAGLGEKAIVVGLSVGGSLGVWSAVARPEVSRAVLISPLILPSGYQEWQLPLIIRALRLSPADSYSWWDDATKDTGPKGYAYPRYSLKGLAAMLALTRWAEGAARSRPAETRATVLLVRNDGDPRLDSGYNEAFLGRFVPADRLSVYRIPASAGLGHDLVCPDPLCENYAHIGESYRYLSEALGITLPDPAAK